MEQKRRFVRFTTTLSAEYSLKGSERGGGNCTVIDISLNGVSLECQASEPIALGATVVLKIFDAEKKETVGAEGLVKWNKQTAKGFVCGIELTDALDKFSLSVLGV